MGKRKDVGLIGRLWYDPVASKIISSLIFGLVMVWLSSHYKTYNIIKIYQFILRDVHHFFKDINDFFLIIKNFIFGDVKIKGWALIAITILAIRNVKLTTNRYLYKKVLKKQKVGKRTS